MTLDHIGMYLEKYQNCQQIAIIFRDLGRISFPIFVFLLIEGIKHTRNIKKYFTRLGILEITVLIGQIICKFLLEMGINDFYSPIIDLLLIASFIYLIKRKDKISYLALLPFAYLLINFIVINIEWQNGYQISWFPSYIRSCYSLFGLILGIGFYYSNALAILFLRSKTETENLVESDILQETTNIISSLIVMVGALMFYMIYMTTGISYSNLDIQVYGALAFIPFYFYSGKLGYCKKWFKYGMYIYFPMHLIIITLIFALL